ncbi:hypothetical protein AVEN_196658-1 [Araneus ventricosus]|uniref:Uncharacterized protein n=1 Tax=Araneus ventricosus TaxID=182803 RepID=A0A4Y2E5I6_ARAVE|nr:hypothetical protein AVEN_196658-1 [Araneus ventricosus]
MHGRLHAVPRHLRSAALRARSSCVETSENRSEQVRTVRWMTKQVPSETIQELSSSNGCVGACGWELFGHPPYSPDLLRPIFTCFYTRRPGSQRSASKMTRNCTQASVHC